VPGSNVPLSQIEGWWVSGKRQKRGGRKGYCVPQHSADGKKDPGRMRAEEKEPRTKKGWHDFPPFPLFEAI